VTIAAAVLAAGEGSRFDGGAHKLLMAFGDSTVAGRAVASAVAAQLDETLVVVGAVDLSTVLPSSVRVVVNDRWSDGIASSLARAVQAARSAGHDALVVGLADQPLVSADDWKAVAHSDCPIAVATYGGRRRNPVRLGREVWDLLPTSGDEGGRSLMRLRPDLVCEIPCQGEPADIDTVEDLERWS